MGTRSARARALAMPTNSALAPAFESVERNIPEAVGRDEVGDTSFQKFGYINASVFLRSDALPNSLDFLTPDGFELSFASAGFADCSSDAVHCFCHQQKGVTVEWSAEDLSDLQIEVNGIDTEDIRDWSLAQLDEKGGAARFGADLLKWTTAQRVHSDEDEADNVGSDEGEADNGGLDFLPTPEELGVDRNRPLLIYTWGKALRKSEPSDSQFNFNACILNGRGGGVDLRTMNGTWEEVQNNVASCSKFPRWLEMACNKIEKSTPALHTISINCTKGRHRSVAAAEIMKRFYYPNAVLRHLTIS